MRSEVLIKLNDLGDLLFQHFWVPLLVWTAFICLFLLISNFQKHQNDFFQYYLRLSLFFSLPIGLIISPFISVISKWFSVGDSQGPVLLIPPTVDLSSIQYNFTSLSDASFSVATLISTLSIILGVIVLYRFYTFALELYHLARLKNLLEITSLTSVNGLSGINRKQVERIKKNVSIAFSDNNHTPFTFGWKKPVVVVPQYLLSDSIALNMMISHELIHIRRNDFLINLFVAGLNTVFFFHPVMRILSNQINDFREITCDQEVITEFHASPSKYAKLIFSFSTSNDRNPHLQIALAKFNSNLTKRIKKMSTIASNHTLNIKNKISITLIATCITLLVACTETSSQVESAVDDLNTKTPLLNFNTTDSASFTFYLDGEPIEYEALTDAINVNSIGSISINDENGKKAVRIISKENQENETAFRSTQNSAVFAVVDKMPELKGGPQSIASEIVYPEEAKKAGIEGRVVVTFVVDKEGNVQNPQIVRGIGGGCDEEALRIIKGAQFVPGEQNGEKVNVQFTLPIIFTLS